MITVAAEGQFFVQGSVDKSSKADERPVFKSSFGHNYCLDTTEVTLAEYHRVMGKIPFKYDSIAHYDLQWPVCFVTWYDAVLYCNRRSRIDGFDTVYSYSAIDSGINGNVYRMHGISSNLNIRGYRLPTEAEWEFAAHAGLSQSYIWGNSPESTLVVKYAWCSLNAGGAPHPVAQLAKNHFGFYDMAGNIMEWVNDKKGGYPTGEVVDYIGSAASPEDYRPVKGGSYRHSIERLRIANRSDDYEIISSTQGSYLGFRCAFGTIGKGVLSVEKGTVLAMPQVLLAAIDIRQIIGTNKAKIAFVNNSQRRRVLCFVDFSVPGPKVEYFLDSSNVYTPTISPDGRWVAYATRDDGAYDGSKVYIRNLSTSNSKAMQLADESAFSPRWWVDPATNDTFIIYTTSSIRNLDPSWPSSATKMQKVQEGAAVGSPVVIESAGGYHDGRSKDGRYLATGYDRLRMKDLVTGECKTLFTAPQNGKTAGDTSQVCNVSISPGTKDPAEVMFLDFGYPYTSTVTQRSYRLHECIFVADFDNRITSWITSPSGFVWSHPEWSTDPDFASVALESSDGTHCSAGIVNMQSGLYTEVLRGSDLLFPYLWVGSPDSFPATDLAVDSAGYYNEPPSNYAQATLSWKLSLFWKYREQTDVYFVGSSRIFHGIRPQDLTIYKGLNVAANGADLQTSLQLIRSYIFNHGKRTKLIGLEVMIDWMDVANGDQSWSDGLANSRGYVYDRNNSFWSSYLPVGFTQLVAKAPNAAPLSPDKLLGFYVHVLKEGWGGPNPPVRAWEWAADTQTCQDNLRMIDNISLECAKRGIHLLVIIMPQSPFYREMGYFGRYGATLRTASDIMTRLRNMEQDSSYFHLYDAHNNGLHDYTDIDAADCDHLSEIGAQKFSHRIDSLINVILQ